MIESAKIGRPITFINFCFGLCRPVLFPYIVLPSDTIFNFYFVLLQVCCYQSSFNFSFFLTIPFYRFIIRVTSYSSSWYHVLCSFNFYLLFFFSVYFRVSCTSVVTSVLVSFACRFYILFSMFSRRDYRGSFCVSFYQYFLL